MHTSRSWECRLQKSNVLFGILAIVLMLCGDIRIAWGQEDHSGSDSTFTLYWENDAFTGTDRNYTNGFKLTWGKAYTQEREASGGLTKWMIDHLPFINDPQAQRGTSISIGQNIYTPEDTDESELIEDDRPYAGFSYIGFGFVSQKSRRRDVWELDIGIVGPLSQAQEVQDFVHDRLDFDRANGWDHQVEKEPFVADLMTGVVIRFGSLQLSYAYILRTKEFEKQEKSHRFGAVNLAYTY